jgi:tRNA A-37 threonylcarbamoyl transferase component Bud32
MTVAETAAAALQRTGLNTVGRALRCLGDHVVAWSRSTDTVRVGRGSADGEPTLYVKRYHYPKVFARWRTLIVRRDRAQREYDRLSELERRELPVVRALATGRRKRWGMLRSCLLITEGFEGGQSLEQVTLGWKGKTGERRELIRAVARAVAAMHAAGVVHGQLFRRNVLIRPVAGGGYDVRFLDFALSPGRGRCGGGAAGDLGALGSGAAEHCSRTDITRFMRTYFGARKLGKPARELMRAAGETGRRFEQSERRRHRLARLFEETDAEARKVSADAAGGRNG